MLPSTKLQRAASFSTIRHDMTILVIIVSCSIIQAPRLPDPDPPYRRLAHGNTTT